MYISYDGASENMARVIVLDGANSYNLEASRQRFIVKLSARYRQI